MSLGRTEWKAARQIISRLLSTNEPALRDNAQLRAQALVRIKISSVNWEMQFISTRD
jgi:hypothetical protein